MDDRGGVEGADDMSQFCNPNLTLEQLLAGVKPSDLDGVDGGEYRMTGRSSTGYQPWSTYTDEDPLNLSWAHLGDFNTNSFSDYSHSGHTSPTFSSGQTSPTNFASGGGQIPMFRDFAPQVVQADSNSENGSENTSMFGGRHDGFSAGIDFSDSLKRGNVFSGAMNNNSSHSNWTDYMPQYNPFGTSTVLQELEKNRHDRPGPKPKRSYSDVAKNRPKSTNGQEEHEGRERRSSSLCEDQTMPVGTSGFKGKKKGPVKSRGFASKRGQSKDNLCSNILPDAKYGLDSFDEPVLGGERDGSERSDSTDNLSETGKTSSTASGIDEIHLSTNMNAYGTSASGRTVGSRYDPVLGDIDIEPEVVHNDDRKPETKAFFDPKRIFAPRPNNAPTKKSTKNSIPNNRDNSKTAYSNDEEFILNNGKCRSNFNSSTAPKTASYINNDLRDRSEPRKQTNTDAKLNHDRVNSSVGNHADGGANCRVNKQKSHEGQNHGESQRAAKQKKVQMDLGIVRLLGVVYLWMKWCAKDVVAAMFLYVVATTWRVITLLTSIVKFYTVSVCSSTYSRIKNWLQSLFPQRYKTGRTWSGMPSYQQQSYGLEENIPLPSTGDEAMKRLLSCSRGKDPYSILGLRSDCSDDDIKRYYRKQAVLVHPDKNSQPGAEEAFKILGHAFELIGKPEKRLTYDQQCKETRAAEEAMQEFADLLTKLQEKMQEAANMMRCDHCGGKHRRIPVDRPCYSARQCDRCRTRHSAKEGDVWAESSMLGFLWYYYACMDNKIYDITEWAACRQGDYFKHMLANSHHVIYRMAVNSNRHQHHHHQGRQGQGGNEGDLEDFINHLFTKSMQNDQKEGFAGSQQPNRPAWNSANKTNKKRGKKKKH